MLIKLTEKVIEKWILNGAISKEEKEVYCYGLLQGLGALLNVITVIFVSFVFGHFWEGILVHYIPLRV